jgi:hypothetical protein
MDGIPDCIHHDPAAVLFGAPAGWVLAGHCRQQWREQRTFGIGGVGRVAGASGGNMGRRMYRRGRPD